MRDTGTDGEHTEHLNKLVKRVTASICVLLQGLVESIQ